MASTAIEMLTFPTPCRKMMVFGMESGPESDVEGDLTDAVDGDGGKRSLSEAYDDQERGHVKKRRKQSKPVRIASSEAVTTEDTPFVHEVKEERGVEFNGAVEMLSLGSFSGTRKDIATNGNSSRSSSTCSNNSVINTTTSIPVATNTTTTTAAAIASSSSNISHSSTSSNSSSSVVSEDLHCYKQCGSKSSEFKDDDEVEEGQLGIGNVTSNGMRIKENDTFVPINLSNMKNSYGFLEGFGRCESEEKQVRQHSASQEEPATIATSVAEIPSYHENLETTQYKKDNIFVSTTPAASSPSPLSQMKQVNMANSGSPGLRIFNPEAFCDLCNKEFCNKYFLKTHKANKHGIYIDNIGPSVIDALPPLPFNNYFSSTNIQYNSITVLPSTTSGSTTATVSSTHMTARTFQKKPQLNVQFPYQNPATAAAILLKNSGNNGVRAFCNICQREFCNKYFVRRHKAKIHGIIEPGYSDNSMDFDQKFQYGQEKCEDQRPCNGSLLDKELADRILPQNSSVKEEPESKNPQSSTNLHSIFGPLQLEDERDLAGEKMKKIGVVNSEAFCDICCKEYCNKYFLRTHKLKSHGIIPTDIDKKEERMMMMMNFSESLQQSVNNQPMDLPLNLIVGDSSTEKPEKNYTQEAGKENAASDDVVCSTCGRTFKTLFLLKMHNSYEHSEEKEEVEKGSTMERKSNQEERCVEEFQKIHNMVLKLNSSNDMGFCEICRRDFGNPSYLETHIINEHANLLEEMGTISEEESFDYQAPNPTQDSKEKECNICQKSFLNAIALEQHTLESHSAEQIPFPSSTKVMKEEDYLKANQMNVYPQSEIQTTPTSSFCEICKKELCNKYFMKTHMQRMHGISIENGAHIGGVLCDICNKELCSKYFLRVHKQNSHGIVDDVSGVDMSRNQSPNADSSLRPCEQNDQNNRYFSHFTEVCAICSRRFRSMKWLKAHLLNDHGDEGREKWREFQSHFELRRLGEIYPTKEVGSVPKMQEVKGTANGTPRIPNPTQPRGSSNEGDEVNKGNVFNTIFNGKSATSKQYQCSYCSFSTSILAFLFVHERSHVGNASSLLLENHKFQCHISKATFESAESCEKHQSQKNNSATVDLSPLSQRGKANDQAEKNTTAILQEEVARDCGGDNEDENGEDIGRTIRTKDCVKVKKESHEMKSSFKCDTRQSNEFNQKDTVGRRRQESIEKDDINGALCLVKESLDLIANKTDIPVSFSLPQNCSQGQVIMQPFVLEDSGQFTSTTSLSDSKRQSFLSSIVFLPVKERLKTPILASFKLTPT